MTPIPCLLVASTLLACGCDLGNKPSMTFADPEFTLDPTSYLQATPLRERTIDGILTLNGSTPAAAGPSGEIYIVDRSGRRIVAYDSLLRVQRASGRRGAGPGEFSEPSSIGVLGDGRLVILDRALRRIVLLQWSADTAEAISNETIQLGGSGEALCVGNNDELVVLGLEEQSRIRIIDTKGNRLRSFAPVKKGLSALGADALTTGLVACDTASDRLVVSYKFLPYVETYRLSSGELLGVDTLTPFRALQVIDKGKSFTIASGRHGYSEPVSLILMDSVIVIQAEFRSRQDDAADTVITYAKATSSRVWHLQADLPPLARLRGTTALAVVGDSTIQAKVLRLAF